MRFYLTFLLLFLASYPTFASLKKKKKKEAIVTIPSKLYKQDSVLRKVIPFDLADKISVKKNKAVDGILWFAKKQLGTPYKYASADPKNGGLDCSGFLYYVFGHFDINVPRSSKDYMNYGKPITQNNIQKGDVLVFTGSDASKKIGGHVGIVLENENGNISFIHGASGKGKGVTISNLSESYYQQRFLKAVRIIK